MSVRREPTFEGHDGLKEFSKPQWEESINPEGFSPSEATFKGGEKQPAAPKEGKPISESDFPSERTFSQLTGKRVDIQEVK